MTFSRKRCDRTKCWLAYKGKATLYWITKEDTYSPASLTDILKLTAAVGLYEGRNIMTMNAPNAFIRGKLVERLV